MSRFLFVATIVWFSIWYSAPAAHALPIGFVVAERPSQRVHNDSYVIEVDSEDTALLAQARAIVAWIEAGEDPATAPDAQIVVTAIAKGADGINRDLLAPGEPLWSWRQVGAPSFAGSTIEILDGWPTYVESDVDGWLANTNGYVGFWSYTVVSELTQVPEPAAMWLVLSGCFFLAVWLKQTGKVTPATNLLRRNYELD